jgi:carbon monoxide dehydrogenase subunit G
MKFKLELPIDKPLAEVWKAFDNPENVKIWQPSLISIDQVSGTQGQPGAVSKLTYKENECEFSLIEKVTYREELHRLDGVYENNFADNVVRNTFVEQGDTTLWLVDTEFKFKTLIMKILGPMMKKNFVARTHNDMERFKKMVESQ